MDSSYVGYDPINHIDPDGRRAIGPKIKATCARLVVASLQSDACDKIFTLGKTAENVTITIWGKHVDGDPTNAFRHAYWMGLNSIMLNGPLGSFRGMNYSIAVGDAYESDNMKACVDKYKAAEYYGERRIANNYCKENAKMDKANNRVGASMVGLGYFGCTDQTGSNWLPKCILRNMEKGQALSVLQRRETKRGPKFKSVITKPITAPTCTSSQSPWCP